MATHLERIGVEPHAIEICLGPALKGVAGTYRQYGYLPKKAAARQAWADELLAALGDAHQAAAEPNIVVPAGTAAAAAGDHAVQALPDASTGVRFSDAGGTTRRGRCEPLLDVRRTTRASL